MFAPPAPPLPFPPSLSLLCAKAASNAAIPPRAGPPPPSFSRPPSPPPTPPSPPPPFTLLLRFPYLPLPPPLPSVNRTAVKFYAALTELAGKAAPVTVDTLRMPEDKARRSLRRNGFFSVALALVVVIFSGVTYVTVSMSKDIENGIEHANDLAVKLRSQVGPPNPGNIQETTCGVATEPPKPELSSKDEILIISELQDFSSTIRTILRTSMKLDFFVRNWRQAHWTRSTGRQSGSGIRKPNCSFSLGW